MVIAYMIIFVLAIIGAVLAMLFLPSVGMSHLPDPSLLKDKMGKRKRIRRREYGKNEGIKANQ